MPPNRSTPPPADLTSKRAANAKTARNDVDKAQADLDALRAEVAAETPDADLPPGVVAVPLADTTVLIKDLLDWPSSANEDFLSARWTRWARKVLYSDNDFQTWAGLDPTNRQVSEFLGNWEKVTGIKVGELLASLSL
jgi:hypothetical protein